MRIINVLEIINGVPAQIESFIIEDDQLSGEIIEEAEKFFIELCKAELSEEDIEFILDEGSYDDQNGHEVYLIWSN